jgi:tetratricopeptide (TPR) repeat protein/peroxiredoxin
MKNNICLIPLVVFISAMQILAADLTARKYEQSPVELLVEKQIENLQKHDQPFSEQIDLLRRTLHNHPDMTVIHRMYQDLMRNDSLDALLVEYKKLAEANPNNAMYCYLYSRIAPTAKERFDWANKAIQDDPNYYWGHLALGFNYLNSDVPDPVKAEQEFLKAIAIDNSISAAFVNLAQLYEHQGDNAKMLQMYRLASICEPDEFSYVTPIIRMQLATNPDMAIQTVQDFLKNNPNDFDAMNTLQNLYSAQKKYNEALQVAERSITVTEPKAEDWLNLADAYTMAQKPDSAFIALDNAINKGWTDKRQLQENSDLASLRSDPRWNDLMGKIQKELDRTEPQRRQEALKNQLNIPAPAFSYPTMDGKTMDLASLRGKVVVIDFWALWCGWCKKAMPLIQEFWTKYQDKDVMVLGMNIRERQRKQVPAFIQKSGYTYPIVYGEEKVCTDYGVRGIPHLVVIDKNGVIRYINIGYSPDLTEKLSWQVDSLLK